MTTEKRQSCDASTESDGAEAATSAARRDFLAKCGRLAVITPPAVTLLLSAASHNYAVASSGTGDPGRHRHHHRHHHHHHDNDHDNDRDDR